MGKIIFAILLSVVVGGCATTRTVEETAAIDIGDDKSVPVRFKVDATAFEDTVVIDINNERKFEFVFGVSTAAKTLEEEIGYNGNLLKAACKLDASSEKSTLSYTAHECILSVNGERALRREF